MTRRLIACGLLVLASVTACGTRTADTGSATLPTSTPSSTASPAAAAGESAAAPAVKRCDATVGGSFPAMSTVRPRAAIRRWVPDQTSGTAASESA